MCEEDRELAPANVRRALGTASDEDILTLEVTLEVTHAGWRVARTHVHQRTPLRSYLGFVALVRGRSRAVFRANLATKVLRRGEAVLPAMLREVFARAGATPEDCGDFSLAHCAARRGRPWDVWTFPVEAGWRLVHEASGRSVALHYADGAARRTQAYETTLVVPGTTNLVREPLLSYAPPRAAPDGLLFFDQTCAGMLPLGAWLEEFVLSPENYCEQVLRQLDAWLASWLDAKLRAFCRTVAEDGVADGRGGRLAVPLDVLGLVEAHYRAGYDGAMFSRHGADPLCATQAGLPSLPWLAQVQ